MTAPRRARRDDGGAGGPLAGTATLRGGLLIGAAVLLGVVLLGKGFDSGFLPSSSEDPSDQVATGDDDDDSGDDETTTTTALELTHLPAEVRVQVLNSSAPVGGSAGAATDVLSAATYNVIDATNATDRTATASAVYAAPGYEADARAIGAALGITAEPLPMPNPPPPPAPADVNVVVVLGPDFVAPTG